MVTIFLILLMLIPGPAYSITIDEVSALLNLWDDERRQKAENIDIQNRKALIPESPEKEPEKKPEKVGKEIVEKKAVIIEKKPESDPKLPKEKPIKKATSKKWQGGKNADRGKNNTVRGEGNDEEMNEEGEGISQIFFEKIPGEYASPPRSGYEGAVDAEAPPKKQFFGIRIGTWIEGELRRSATNSEPGLIEIYTTKSVPGRRKSLPAGTTLFANKGYNSGTKKLDLLVEKGITPDGLEFEIQGLVFDLQKTAGLIGIISADSTMIVERSTSKGLLAAGGEVVNQLGQGSLVGAAGSAAADSLLNDTGNVIEEKTRLKQTIRSSPQHLLIRVEETF